MSAAVTRTARIDVIRLHVDPSGFVWKGHDHNLGDNSYLEPDVFVGAAQNDLLRGSVIRVLGVPGNAALITALHALRLEHPSVKQKVFVGSPALLQTSSLRSDPEAVMQMLWQPPPSLGGIAWHEVSTRDYASYALIAEIYGKQNRVSETALRIARYHPAWAAVTFIDSVNLESVCRLLCDIVDPRWFMHPHRPGRPSRLYAHLGLTPHNARCFVRNEEGGHNYGRALNAINAWFKVRPKTKLPGDFAWRAYVMASDREHGILQATRKFVDYIRLTWWAVVGPTHQEFFFSPEQFFRNDEYAKAFIHHIRTWRPV